MSFDLEHLAALTARGPVARIVVTRTAGSVPREAGTVMYVWEDGQDGTIGGGRLEWEAVVAARTQTDALSERTYPLGPGLGQCCGGSVTLVTEVFTAETLPTLPYARPLKPNPMPTSVERKLAHIGKLPAPVIVHGWLIETAPPRGREIWVWGSGHVGRALVAVLAPLADIKWVDIAQDRFPSDIPFGVTDLVAVDPVQMVKHAPKTAEHVILTHSHELDLALCHALLAHGFSGLGLIGSQTKRARFFKRLADLGHRQEQIARIVCPIGDPSLGKHPQAIALGVATDVLQRAHIGQGTGQGNSDTA
ncbi:xanthine dehydrogenase accessory protein XdhC [Marivivens donghaensis]|uniref:Xanthine dehydrogenase accessory protein XdhC n=1 Tax=Marivivens donghaensis TaxID=1699413 RepID=A0ABX0VTB3_9RHOB|nr:xanthine dehydrogenase accessory protein XdhC [Marivivens donghaensis]